MKKDGGSPRFIMEGEYRKRKSQCSCENKVEVFATQKQEPDRDQECEE